MGKKKGYGHARKMRQWADRKGGFAAAPDGFDRSSAETLASQIDEWFARLEERAYSPRTVETHRWALRMFLGWARERDLSRPEDITKPILESYQRWLYRYRQKNGEPLSNVTQRMRLGALQRFFAWLCRENRLSANPAADLELPRKQPRSLPRALNAEELAAVFAVPDTSDPLGVRERTILETLYATGLRRLEIVQLDLEDLDLRRGVLYVRRGKGNKDRVVPLGARACGWLTRYLETVRPLLAASLRERALFLTGYGERYNPGSLGQQVRQCFRKAGLERSGSCHLLRHSCATHMHENGADIRMIQQLLGHARLDTTQIYTAVSIEQLKAVHGQTHPSCQSPAKSGLRSVPESSKVAP